MGVRRMTMTYTELIEKEPRLIREPAEFENGLLLCNNCESPASALMTIAIGWVGCAPCITGEADSFDEEDLIIEK